MPRSARRKNVRRITGDPEVDQALERVLRGAPSEGLHLVRVGGTQWGVVVGRCVELPERKLKDAVFVFEVLRTTVTLAPPYLGQEHNILWFVRGDGELCVVFVRDRRQRELADVYVGWPVYFLEPAELCAT